MERKAEDAEFVEVEEIEVREIEEKPKPKPRAKKARNEQGRLAEYFRPGVNGGVLDGNAC